MKPDFEKIYFYSASLISLVVIIIILVLVAGSLVDYFIPSAYFNGLFGMDERTIREQIVFEKYGPDLAEKEIKEKIAQVTEEEVENYKKRQVKMARNESLRSLMREAIALIFVFPIYGFHFSKARRLSSQNQKENRS